MRRTRCEVLLSIVWFGVVSPGLGFAQSCEEATLTNDDNCQINCPYQLCACFVAGEMAAVQLEAPAHWYPLEILEVQVFWGSSHNSGSPTVAESIHIFRGNTFPNPGVQVAELEAPQLNEGFLNRFVLDQWLASPVIIDSGKFSIALEFAEDNAEDVTAGTVWSDSTVGNGGNGCTTGKNMVFALSGLPVGWYDACLLGVSGDWVMRAVVRCIDGDLIRMLSITSEPSGSLVNPGDVYMVTPFDLTVLEGESSILTAFGFSPGGEPFAFWEVDGAFFSDLRTIEVGMNTGGDRSANAVYGAAGNPPEIVHVEGLPGQTRPHSGYIDPRSASTNGATQDRGIEQLTIVFSEPVRNIGGAPLSASAFETTSTGGNTPSVESIDASGNPTVVVILSGPIPVGHWTTVRARVEDLAGNPIPDEGDLGPFDEKDRVDIGFLPMDQTQNQKVGPDDLIRFRQIFAAGPGGIAHGFGLPTDFADIDRDGMVRPSDLIRFRQGLAGTPPSMQGWLTATIIDRP